MASWLDFLSLAVTLSVAAGVVFGLLYLGRATSQVLDATKQGLKNRGVNVSHQGVSVKTNKRLDRSDYLDATQRGFVKAYNNATFGPGAGVRSHSTESIHANGGHPTTNGGSASAPALKKTGSIH